MFDQQQEYRTNSSNQTNEELDIPKSIGTIYHLMIVLPIDSYSSSLNSLLSAFCCGFNQEYSKCVAEEISLSELYLIVKVIFHIIIVLCSCSQAVYSKSIIL